MSKQTNIYFDFELIDDGREIIPISLGMCTKMSNELRTWEPGQNPFELYLEYAFDPARANDWVRENVLPHLNVDPREARRGRWDAACRIAEWVKQVCDATKPRFIGYYPSYDWVCLCQHWGTMDQVPKGWPIRPECLMQMADELGVPNDWFPKQSGAEHHALADARWNRELHQLLCSESARLATRLT